MKNKKSYTIPLKVDSPIMRVSERNLSIWDKKKIDEIDLKIPNWLWECIESSCTESYERGKLDAQFAIKNVLGIH